METRLIQLLDECRTEAVRQPERAVDVRLYDLLYHVYQCLRGTVTLALLLTIAAPLAAQDWTRWAREHHATLTTPPADWRGWWDDLAARCECTPAVRFDELQVWVVEAEALELPKPYEAEAAGGFWLYDGTLVFARRYMSHHGAVQHEMLHAMLGALNAKAPDGHPAIFRRLGLDAAWLRLGAR